MYDYPYYYYVCAREVSSGIMIDPIERISVTLQNIKQKGYQLPPKIYKIERKSRCFCFPYLSRQSHCCFGKNDKYNHTSLLTDKHKPRVGSLPREVRSLLGGGLAQVTLLLDAQKFFVGPKDTILNFMYDMDWDLGMV